MALELKMSSGESCSNKYSVIKRSSCLLYKFEVFWKSFSALAAYSNLRDKIILLVYTVLYVSPRANQAAIRDPNSKAKTEYVVKNS